MKIGLALDPARRVFAGFALYSFCMGNIFPRIPDIRADMGVAEGALGLGLIGAPVGTFISLTFAAPLIEKLGFRVVLMAAIPLMAFFYAIASHATNPASFFVGLIPVGLMIGCVEIVLNVEADRVEALIHRRIMNRAHSFWSFGIFGAGLCGAAFAQAGVSPQAHLAAVVPMGLIGVALLYGGYEPAPKRPTTASDAAPKIALPSGPVMVLVVITLGALLMEGASWDWSAIYMHDTFHAGPFLVGFVVAMFGFTQAAARYLADAFVDRYSPASVARWLSVLLGAGVVLVFTASDPFISLFGFGLMGIGSSAIFPLAVSAAAKRTDRPSAINVAALAQFSFVIFLLGPPLLGFVAQHWGIRWTYGLGLPLVAIAYLLAGALGKERARPSRR